MNTALNKTGEIIREQKENLTEHYDKLRMTQVKVIEPCSQKSVKVGTMAKLLIMSGLKTHATMLGPKIDVPDMPFGQCHTLKICKVGTEVNTICRKSVSKAKVIVTSH